MREANASRRWRRALGFASSAFFLCLGCELLVVDGIDKRDDDEMASDGGTPACTMCGDECVDLLASEAHCGACESACPPETFCLSGVCRSSTPGDCEAEGLTECGGACVDVTSDPSHCGACDNACPGTCTGGSCSGEPSPYAFRHSDFPLRPVGPPGSGCDGGSEGELAAVNTPLTSSSGDRVDALALRWSLDTFIGEPTRLAAYAWFGSGSLYSVLWVAAVTDAEGQQYVNRAGERIYASWSGGTVGAPGEGFGTDVTGSPSWSETFVVVIDGEPRFEVSLTEAQDIFSECIHLRDLQVLGLDDDPALVSP